MSTNKNSVVITVSKIISNFFNPLTSMLIYFIWFSNRNFTFNESLGHFLPILIIIIIPISVWIIWNVMTGRYTNLDVSDRNQRKSLYVFILLVTIIYLIFDYLKNEKVDLVMLFTLILLVLMQVSNFFIKSSMHTAFNVFVAGLFYSENKFLGFIWLGIAFLVGISRIILKRHTPKEVVSGTIIALLVSFAYIYTKNQIIH